MRVVDPPVSSTVQDYLNPGTVPGEAEEIGTVPEESPDPNMAPAETADGGNKDSPQGGFDGSWKRNINHLLRTSGESPLEEMAGEGGIQNPVTRTGDEDDQKMRRKDDLWDEKVEMIPLLMLEELEEPEKVEMTPFLRLEELDEPEKDGEDAESERGGLPVAKLELAGALATKSETKIEGPVMLNEPGPIDQPEFSLTLRVTCYL